jgi:hypothetical protein
MFLRIVSLTLVLAPLLGAQGTPKIRAGLSPVPLWPQDGDTSRLPKDQYVFYDPPAGEYVVYYAAPAGDTRALEPVVLRFGTHGLVDPTVTVTISAGGTGSLHYAYEVSNGSYARQSIQKMSLLVGPDSNLQAMHPTWTNAHETSGVRDITAPTAQLAAVEWASNTATETIAPGRTLRGFALDSTLLPGFTTMVFKGATQSHQPDAEAIAALPPEVRDQIARIFRGAWDVKTRLVIGPRFPTGTPHADIAQNFLFGLQSLTRERLLDPDSSFVQGVNRSLSAQLESGGRVAINPNSIAFETAKPGLEATLANALRMALAP